MKLDFSMFVARLYTRDWRLVTKTPRAYPRRCLPVIWALLLCVAFGVLGACPAMALVNDCSQPTSSGADPVAGDCLFILRSAVGLVACDVCVCDVNGSGEVFTSDALLCLGLAVKISSAVAMCPACVQTTTTTTAPISSTSSSSTLSTTTTLAAMCLSDADCADLPAGHRCNPNNDLCEKPCTVDDDCKGFFECDRPSGFCVDPGL